MLPTFMDDSICKEVYDSLFVGISFFPGFLQAFVDTFLIDVTQAFGRNFEGNPFVLFRDEEPLGMKVGKESPEGLPVGVGYLVPFDRGLTCYFAYTCHDSMFFRLLFENGVQRTEYFLRWARFF